MKSGRMAISGGDSLNRPPARTCSPQPRRQPGSQLLARAEPRVDLVLQQGKSTVALEVKSGRRRESLAGMETFARQFNPKRKLRVGGQGVPLEESLFEPAQAWLK